MKVIDELIRSSRNEKLLEKAKLDTGEVFEHNGNSIIGQIVELYGVGTEILNAELTPIVDAPKIPTRGTDIRVPLIEPTTNECILESRIEDLYKKQCEIIDYLNSKED